MKKNNLILYALLTSIVVVGIALDLVTKTLAFEIPKTEIIPFVLSFQYTSNEGVAWGMFSGHMTLLIIITALIIATFISYIFMTQHKGKTLFVASGLIIAGAFGNLLDRIFLGYVRDFIKFDFLNFINFPICNVADVMLTAGMVVLFVHFIFLFPKLERKMKGRKID